MDRCCQYTPCGAALVLNPGERPTRFRKRNFCGTVCRAAYVNARKIGTSYAKAPVSLRSEAQQKSANAWGKARRHTKRVKSPTPSAGLNQDVADFLAKGGTVTRCPPMGAFGAWEEGPGLAIRINQKRGASA